MKFGFWLVFLTMVAGSEALVPDDPAMPRTGRIAAYDGPIVRAAVTLDDDVVAGCVNCHRDGLSLAKFEAEPLAEVIGAIIRNEVSHVVPIAALSEEDLGALAKALAEPESAGANQ